MIALTLKEIADATAGRLEGADPDAIVGSISIDSRSVMPGALFVALRGENGDGHEHARAAVDAGAACVLVSEDVAVPSVRVDDTLRALGAVAAAVRARVNATVIAITGSSGKTCTKDMAAAACAGEKRTVASEASFNNEIGVPLTICSASEDTEVLVVEVGSRGIGHIDALMPIVRPDVSVVTNIGPAHVGMFGSLENTARAKGEIVEALATDGTAVLNADDELVRATAERTRARTVWFGHRSSADVHAEHVVLDDDARASFTVVAGDERAPVSLRLPGEHMVHNALAAIAAARAAGVSLRGAAEGVSRAEGSAWRMEIIDIEEIRIVNDAYNANPDSMAAALKALVAMAHGRPSWAVLGHMAELGDASLESHDRIGRLVVRLGVHHLITVGEQARAIHEAARLEGMFGGEAAFANDAGEAVQILKENLEQDAVVLVKASRAAGLEWIVEALGA